MAFRIAFHRASSHQIIVNDFSFPIWLQELLQTPSRFLSSFCFARIRLDPLGGQVLHHDCISVIVSRFAIVTEDFVICCYQDIKIFCTRYGSAIASYARGSCSNFGPHTDLAISVFREVSKNVVYSVPLLPAAPKAIHEKNWKHVDFLEHFHQPIHPGTPVANRAHFANSPLCNSSSSFFLGFFDFCCSMQRVPPCEWFLVRLFTSSVAGISVSVTVQTVSCDEDAGEVEEVEELVDKPGTTSATWLPYLDEMWFRATGPLVTVPKFFAEFSKWKNCRCVFKKHCRHEWSWLSLPSSDFSTSSRSPIRLRYGLSCWTCACLLRNLPQTLSFFGFIVDAAGTTHSSEGAQNVALLGRFPRNSAGASLLSLQSLLEILSSNFFA